MALPSNHRWIALGHLTVRRRQDASSNAPVASLGEIIDRAKTKLADGTHYREYGSDKSRLMWFSNFGDHNAYHLLLAETGDKNTTGVSFIDFQTRESRDVPKLDNEGGHYTAHVAIAKVPALTGGYLVMVERVPGIYLGSLQNHFAWLCGDEALHKPYADESGRSKVSRSVIEIDGHQSSTIREALKTGSLQDIEFIQTVEEHEDGLDEDSVVKEVIHQAKWDVKQRVTEDQAGSIFGKMRGYFREKFRKGDGDAHMFVRIKTAAGQIKRTEVTDDENSILEQAFVHNALIRDFSEPLAQRHNGLRDDVVSQMLNIPDQLNQARDNLDDA